MPFKGRKMIFSSASVVVKNKKINIFILVVYTYIKQLINNYFTLFYISNADY